MHGVLHFIILMMMMMMMMMMMIMTIRVCFSTRTPHFREIMQRNYAFL